MSTTKAKVTLLEEVKSIYGIYQKQQRANEDRFIVLNTNINKESYRFFAIFDGHGGPGKENHVVDYCVENLPKRLFHKLANTNIKNTKLTIKSITQCFIDFDTEMYNLFKEEKLNYGTTCTAVLIDETRGRIYQINLGDSRSIIFDSKEGTILSETKDHTPEYPGESLRIEAAKGFVRYNRVLGSIAVSRALGDFGFKHCPAFSHNYDPVNSCLSAVPDIIVTPITLPMSIILTSDSPFSVPGVNNKSLVGDYIKLNTVLRGLQEKEDTPFLSELALSMARMFIEMTTDDTTLILVTV